MGMDEELERFKRDIKLHEYAVSLGYEVDARESSKREVVLRKGTDKISVRMDVDGHYVYYSFRDEKDHGTIMDFVMRRQSKNFGETRKALRIWAGVERVPAFQHLEVAPRGDREAVTTEFKAMKELRWHDYLEQDRAIPRPVLLSPRFQGCIRVDARANAIFPHFDDEGLCGFERRNRGFKAFADRGEKGLWLSNVFPEDRGLVVGESAIDCISHAALFPATSGYASIAGGLNPVQPLLIAKACRELPAGCRSGVHHTCRCRWRSVCRRYSASIWFPALSYSPTGGGQGLERLPQNLEPTIGFFSCWPMREVFVGLWDVLWCVVLIFCWPVTGFAFWMAIKGYK